MPAFDRTGLIQMLQKDSRIQFAYLFGSQAKGRVTPLSDVDIAYAAAPLFSFQDHLGLIEDCMTFLKTSAVDVVDLNAATPLLMREIISGGQLLFTRNPASTQRFVCGALARYFDTAPFRRLTEIMVRRRLKDAAHGF